MKKAATAKKTVKKEMPKVRSSKEELERKKRLAFTLYVDNGFAQKVIADITGISENSISKWKNDGDWDKEREAAKMGPEQQIRRITRMYDVMLTMIEQREAPKNVPTPPEADTLNKLADSAKKLQTEVQYGHKTEVGKQFTTYIQQVYGQSRAVEMVELWHEWLMATT